MKVLVYEYVTGGGMGAGTPSASLAHEGDLMLGALLRDLADIPGVQIAALREARLAVPGSFPATTEWLRPESTVGAEQCFREGLAACDAAWIVAPETGGILERLCRSVEDAGKPLLTSPAAAVRIAASKLATMRRLQDRGVPVVPTVAAADGWAGLAFPVVVKPDDGAGCEGARILESAAAGREFLAGVASVGDYVAQPLVEGEALSLSALFAAGRAKLLSGNRQYIARDRGGFALRGCGVAAVADEAGLFQALAERIAAALPELWGYAGVDLIRSDPGLRVLEINPRLTTSYAGLRAATGLNVAGLVLELWRQNALPVGNAGHYRSVDIFVETGHGG